MNRYRLAGRILPLLFCLSLAACGGGGSSSSSYTASTSAGTGGSIDPAAATVGEGDTMAFTVTPDSHHLIDSVSGCDGTLDGTTYTTGAVTADCTVTASFYPAPVSFSNGQAASVVIGQSDFTNNGSATSQSEMDYPEGNAEVVDGVLFLPDSGNGRVLGYNAIPTSNGADADFVLGASDFTSSESLYVNGVDSDNGELFVADYYNNEIDVYDPVPTAATSAPAAATPQGAAFTLTATDVSGFNTVGTVAVGGGKLVVSDSLHNRVLVWDSIPTADTAPDLVLGQADFSGTGSNRGGTAAADTLDSPEGVWTDGQRLVIGDAGNHRVLIWNTFPTSNGQAADLVLGQADFSGSSNNRGLASPTASTFSYVYNGIFVSGHQLFVADTNNSRVLIWNGWPTANGQAADNVLGEGDFTTVNTGIASDTIMSYPDGVFLYGTQLIVTDNDNSRYLIFNGSY